MPDQYYLAHTPLLLDKTRGVLVDSLPPQELLNLIPGAEEELRSLMIGFNDSVSMESPDAQAFCQLSIQMTHASFEEYTKILREIEGSGGGFNISNLRGITLKLDEADKRLYRAFLTFRNDVMIARGPSSHGGLNLIVNYLQRILYGEDVASEFTREIDDEISQSRNALATLENIEQNVFNNGSRTFYTQYQQLLHFLRESIEKRDNENLAKLSGDLENLGNYYKHFDFNYLVRLYSQSPTPLPLANLVMNTANNYVHGAGEKGVFNYFLNQLREVFNKVRYRYDEISARVKPGSIAEQEEAELIGNTLDEISGSLDCFESLLENPDSGAFLQNWNQLGQSALSFAQSVKMLEALAEDSGKVICFHCGFKNFAGDISCRQCKSLLPQVEDKRTQVLNTVEEEGLKTESRDSETFMTMYINKLFESASGLATGALTAPEFEKVLSDMENKVHFAKKNMKTIPQMSPDMISKMGSDKAERLKTVLDEASSLYKEGIELLSQGILQFRDFAGSLSAKRLEKARETVWQGVKKLQQAQNIIRREIQVREMAHEN